MPPAPSIPGRFLNPDCRRAQQYPARQFETDPVAAPEISILAPAPPHQADAAPHPETSGLQGVVGKMDVHIVAKGQGRVQLQHHAAATVVDDAQRGKTLPGEHRLDQAGGKRRQPGEIALVVHGHLIVIERRITSSPQKTSHSPASKPFRVSRFGLAPRRDRAPGHPIPWQRLGDHSRHSESALNCPDFLQISSPEKGRRRTDPPLSGNQTKWNPP